jgi:hypothetical protein
MEPAKLERQRQFLPQEVVHARPRLEVELEPVAQVVTADVRIGEADACVDKRHPSAAGREMVPQQRRQAQEGALPGMDLNSPPELAEQLDIAVVPPVPSRRAAEHPAKVQRTEREIVALLAAEATASKPDAQRVFGIPGAAAEPAADIVLPDSMRGASSFLSGPRL